MIKSFLGSLKGKKPRAGESSAIASGQASSAESSNSPSPYLQASNEDTDDPPPAYALVAPDTHTHPPPPLDPGTLASRRMTSDSDPYAFLSFFDTVFVIDDSGSMSGPSWRETEAALRSITPICTAHDADGVDLYFLNHRSGNDPPRTAAAGGPGPAPCKTLEKAPGGYYNISSPAVVEDIFSKVRPYGVTPTGSRLQTILKPYLASLCADADAKANADAVADADADADVDLDASAGAVRPVNIIIITDGRATDDPESVIVQAARKLDAVDAPPHQVGIQFFQVGHDRGAGQALRELDDDLAERGVRDMVDAVTWDTGLPMSEKVLSAEGILKVLLGAVIRRVDRRPGVLT